MEQTMALTQQWLTEPTTTFVVASCSDYWHLPYYQPVYVSSPARPIRLTLEEVEQLRQAAAGHPQVKAILQKFTDQIEIIVSFD